MKKRRERERGERRWREKSDHHFEHLTSSSIRYLGVDLRQELVLKTNINSEGKKEQN